MCHTILQVHESAETPAEMRIFRGIKNEAHVLSYYRTYQWQIFSRHDELRRTSCVDSPPALLLSSAGLLSSVMSSSARKASPSRE